MGVNALETAVEVTPGPTMSVGDPSGVPDAQATGDGIGPHTKKSTVPVGAKSRGIPVTVAVSVIDPVDVPTLYDVVLTWVDIEEATLCADAAVTKPSIPAEHSSSVVPNWKILRLTG